ncbi:hypothetical protein PV761_13785 [Arthrobacter sp. CC3]|uniref:hypothetical protein n=1 Tax=Arthrobacter sp. CC3 TaxID=3029185 RepID=UPI003262DF87
MSITPSTKTRPFGTRFALISAVSLGLVGGPVALAAPADASTSLRGCTVDPLKPTDLRYNRADFRISVDCNGNKTVEVRQRRFEQDSRRHETFLGRSIFTEHFDRRDGRVVIHSRDSVKRDPARDRVFQEVSFRVKSGNNWSDWTRWEKSDVAVIR